MYLKKKKNLKDEKFFLILCYENFYFTFFFVNVKKIEHTIQTILGQFFLYKCSWAQTCSDNGLQSK